MTSKKPVLLFAHAFPLNASLWDAQVNFFNDKYEILAPDLRGHRDGPQGPGPWMMAHYAEDINRLLDQRGIERVHFCGNSMGGYVALQFAHKYPEKVASLILCDTRADADTNEAKDKRFALIERLHKEGLEEFAKEFIVGAVGEFSQQLKPDLLKSIEHMILQNRPQDIALVVGALASRNDSTEMLSGLKCPVLVIAGEEDKIIPIDVQRKMAEKIKGARFEKIAKCGHFPSIERPEAFNQLLESFFSENIFGVR